MFYSLFLLLVHRMTVGENLGGTSDLDANMLLSDMSACQTLMELLLLAGKTTDERAKPKLKHILIKTVRLSDTAVQSPS